MESKTILAGLLIGLMIGVFTGLIYAPILDITGQFTRLKKQIDTLQSQIETLQSQIDSLQSQIETLEGQLDEKNLQLAALQSQIDSLQSQIETAREVLSKESLQDEWLIVNLILPREINQANFFQTVESYTITYYNFLPLGNVTLNDERGNRYIQVYGIEKKDSEITFKIESIISRRIAMEPVSTSDPYPIPEATLADIDKSYLQPAYQSPSDDPTIKSLAQNLSKGLDKEADVVNNTLNWISENAHYKCFREIYEEYYNTIVEKYGFFTWTARETLEYRVGVCVDFADLLVALSRAQGIPARVAMGIKGYEDTNPGFLTPVNGSGVHAWTEIFYPEVGWIRYDATYMSHSPHIPYGIQLNAYAVEERETYPLYESKDMEFDWNSDFPWELIGLGENKVKLTYTIKLFPYYP